jgi:surface antigen
VPLGPVDTWAWDGRNQLGQVVANGTYSVTVAPDDGVGTRGTACTVQAIVDNREGTVP